MTEKKEETIELQAGSVLDIYLTVDHDTAGIRINDSGSKANLDAITASGIVSADRKLELLVATFHVPKRRFLRNPFRGFKLEKVTLKLQLADLEFKRRD